MNDISDLVSRLEERGAHKVALQFPAGLKRRGAEYAAALRAAGFAVIISGDPCYGACDLSLDTLNHADVLVHIGHTPVDDREDVIFEPYPVDFDVAVLANALPLLKEKTVGLVTTVQHVHLIPVMESFLREKGIDVRVADGGTRAPNRGQVLGCSFMAARATKAPEILFVGTGVFHPIGIALSTGARVIALDPLTGIAQEVSGDALLRRRFAVIEKARGAETIGIIVSSKSGQARMALAERLSALSPKAVIVTMREVSPDELLNLGFACYVNTACPRLAYDDQVRFPTPVLSPQEFEILCGVRTWDNYAIDEIRMKLKQLEMTLQKAKGYEKPRPSLEQYMTPAPLAARMLYHALMKGDIVGKNVCDLGSGTGVLAIGAALLGAESVKGVEKDPNAVTVAQENAALFGVDVEFITADIQDTSLPEKLGACDTVIMNPPFGAQKIHADRPFVDRALTAAPIVYSIFNAGSTPFIKAFIRKRAEVAEQVGSAFAIKRTFAFHTRDVLEFEVEILRLVRKQ